MLPNLGWHAQTFEWGGCVLVCDSSAPKLTFCLLHRDCRYAVYKYTARGLFERHKLLLSLQMCMRILQAANQVRHAVMLGTCGHLRSTALTLERLRGPTIFYSGGACWT